MKKARELNAVLLGSKSSKKYQVGNIIFGKETFDSRDMTLDCERGEGEVCGRTVSMVKVPGWHRGYPLCDAPELFKTSAILSVTQCPPPLHAFILVINAEMPFKDIHKKATEEHLQHCFGEKVWDHTIVVFSHSGSRGHKTIEDYIKEEGGPLQWVLKACGNRYHTLCTDGTENSEKVKELFDKIDAMVAENSHYEPDIMLVQHTEEKWKEVERKAEELRLLSQQQRQKLRGLLTEPIPSLRVLMVGWVFSRKSATGNSILSADVFQSGERTVKALKQSGVVAGRQVVLVDTPGWWKFFPQSFNPLSLKSEIMHGVSLCSPSPNVILLMLPADTSFTEEQRRITESNMRLFGKEVWRHVIVVFTFGDSLVNKTIEQYIVSEGEPLSWLIKKCGNRYHVIDNTSTTEAAVIDLLEKMEEMVVGNSCFYLSDAHETEEPQPVHRSDPLIEKKDENTAKEIGEQLKLEWDRRNWEKHHIFKGNDSMELPPKLSDGRKAPCPDGDEEETKHDDGQFDCFSPEMMSEDQTGAEYRKLMMRLLEREWARREAVMELAGWKQFNSGSSTGERAMSEPDRDEVMQSRQKVSQWLKKLQAIQNSSGYGSGESTEYHSNSSLTFSLHQ